MQGCRRNGAVAEIGIERRQCRELAPNRIVGQVLPDELVAPGDHMRPCHVTELLRLPQPGAGHEVCNILPVGPPRIRIGAVGKPFDLGRQTGPAGSPASCAITGGEDYD